MNPLIEANKETLFALCRKFRVQRLDLFGSAATGAFDPAVSDLDFLVVFADKTPGTYADRYLDFAEALERLFGRKIDLITEQSVRNPYFQEAVEATRQNIYDESREETPA